ncbi:M23 family metallopeptidase [Anaerotignum sp.]
MNKHQHISQEQKKHSLISHISQKALRFTTAFCAAAMLACGVAYAAAPAASEAALPADAAGSTFTNVVVTAYDKNGFHSDDLIRIDALVHKTDISFAVISNKINAALEKQNHIPGGWPVESRIVSTEFNPTADPCISDGRKHYGMDISTKSQIIPIYATASGTVTTATFHPEFGYYVVIDHENGFTTLYAHCNELTVNAGDTIEKGDIIATTGSTGWSTGIHCHYEIQLNGVYQNPRDYLG